MCHAPGTKGQRGRGREGEGGREGGRERERERERCKSFQLAVPGMGKYTWYMPAPSLTQFLDTLDTNCPAFQSSFQHPTKNRKLIMYLH